MAELEKELEAAFSEDEAESLNDDIPVDPKKKKRKKRIIIFSVIGGVILALIIANIVSHVIAARNAEKNMYKDVAVERRTITKSITGSSSTEPNDSYNVMTMKSGDITADYFKEGDTVKKGDKLYQFDDEEARDSLKSAQNAISKSKNGLTDARSSYNDQYIKSDISGKVTELSVKKGDSVTMGTPIATVYSDKTMKIRLPFNDYDAESVYTGANAEVTVTGSGDVLSGRVTEKASSAVATSSHAMIVYVTIEVTNPGALSESDRGSAVVNGVACADSANFEYITSQKITAKSSGTLRSLSVSEGDSVYVGEQIGYIESVSASTNLSNAQLSLDDAQLNLKKAEDAVKDMVVEAPIDGTVVKKNAKSGDTRDSSNSTEALCVIYDLSSLKIKLDVDETEIAMVKTGLKAKITADAVEGEFEGEVTKVPVDGVNENGVTTYTIEVQIKNYGALLPGMNVDAEIVVEESANVLTVPLNSVNRGDIVFVKDDGKKRDNDVTDRIDDIASIPANTEIPKGYRALQVETGINDNDYIEIKSGLTEEDSVRTLDTDYMSKLYTDDTDIMAQMEQEHDDQRRQMQNGNMGGGPQGGPPSR